MPACCAAGGGHWAWIRHEPSAQVRAGVWPGAALGAEEGAGAGRAGLAAHGPLPGRRLPARVRCLSIPHPLPWVVLHKNLTRRQTLVGRAVTKLAWLSVLPLPSQLFSLHR